MEFQENLQQGYYNWFLLNTAYTGWRTMYYISFWSLRRVCIYLISRKYFSTIVTSIHVVPHIEPQCAKPVATRGYFTAMRGWFDNVYIYWYRVNTLDTLYWLCYWWAPLETHLITQWISMALKTNQLRLLFIYEQGILPFLIFVRHVSFT